jgi:hypothetical protein
MRTVSFGTALLAWALALVPPAASFAQAAPARGRAASGARTKTSLQEVAVMLSSNDDEEVRSALEAAAMLAPREVVPLLEERVRAGLPHVLLDVALDTLLLLADPAAAPLLTELTRHRRPDIRARSLELLARIRASGAERTIARALGDVDAGVRKAAAEALGTLGATGSFELLVRAFELGVEGAPRALGRVASSRDVAKLVSFVGNHPPSGLTPMFEALLARREVAEADKRRVVDAVAALGSDEARAELGVLLKTLPPDASPALRRTLTQAAQSGAAP